MDGATLRVLFYLILTIVGGAGLWIVILYITLGDARRRIILLETDNRKLKRQLEDVKVRVETRSMSDVELLEDVTNLFSKF